MRENLKAARKAAGLTQEAISERLNISPRQYQRIEKGTSLGAIDTWDALEDMFEVNQRVLRENRRGTANSR